MPALRDLTVLGGRATPSSVIELLQRGRDDDVAIVASGRPPLSYGGLRTHVERTAADLRAVGIERSDCVAIVMPGGAELATAFLAVSTAAAAAPLNPAYSEREFRFYLSDLGAKALLVPAGMDTPAIRTARELGVRILRASAAPGAPAGVFVIEAEPARETVAPSHDDAIARHTALLLHTSGTTSRPKLVPLTRANLSASAGHVSTALGLSAADRCLVLMPLFHIHGLVAAVLASLAAGGSIACTEGFDALRVVRWLGELGPTWTTAVPTMYQAIVARADRRSDTYRGRLRLTRSSSAALPAQVMEKLERLFEAPVVAAYGMTEAAHQITSQPLSGERTSGSVGPAAGPEVGILDPGGEIAPPGTVGEIVIRGPNVMPGYAGAPDANAAAFVNGWLRTGDQGVLEGHGCLTIRGRLKEIINRGGEKVSPHEIEAVLLDHPDVLEAVAFAVAHPSLGEDVAAVVVLRAGAGATAEAIRAFAAERLARFKVPRRLFLRAEIPKGPTGKVQRIGFAARLGL